MTMIERRKKITFTANLATFRTIQDEDGEKSTQSSYALMGRMLVYQGLRRKLSSTGKVSEFSLKSQRGPKSFETLRLETLRL
jgi:hypothetical protein